MSNSLWQPFPDCQLCLNNKHGWCATTSECVPVIPLDMKGVYLNAYCPRDGIIPYWQGHTSCPSDGYFYYGASCDVLGMNGPDACLMSTNCEWCSITDETPRQIRLRFTGKDTGQDLPDEPLNDIIYRNIIDLVSTAVQTLRGMSIAEWQTAMISSHNQDFMNLKSGLVDVIWGMTTNDTEITNYCYGDEEYTDVVTVCDRIVKLFSVKLVERLQGIVDSRGWEHISTTMFDDDAEPSLMSFCMHKDHLVNGYDELFRCSSISNQIGILPSVYSVCTDKKTGDTLWYASDAGGLLPLHTCPDTLALPIDQGGALKLSEYNQNDATFWYTAVVITTFVLPIVGLLCGMCVLQGSSMIRNVYNENYSISWNDREVVDTLNNYT